MYQKVFFNLVGHLNLKALQDYNYPSFVYHLAGQSTVVNLNFTRSKSKVPLIK